MPNATVLVIIGTYSAAVHLFGVNSHSGIASLGTSTAFGTNQEALLFVPDPSCNGEANLLAVKNNCACDEFKNGRSGPMCCTARGALVSARITEAGNITKVGEVEYAGVGPIHMGLIQDQIAIADYVGGTAHIYGPIDPSTGVLGDRAVSTTKLSNRSLMHMVTSDPLCKGRRLLAVDSDYPAVVVVDHQTGGLVSKVDMPDRIRRVNFHPSLPVAYIMYEEAGSIGVWSWTRCEAWLDDATTSPPAEVSRFSTMPADPPLPPGTKNKPTSLMLTSNGMYAYTCTRTAFFTPTSVATAQIGVFRVDSVLILLPPRPPPLLHGHSVVVVIFLFIFLPPLPLLLLLLPILLLPEFSLALVRILPFIIRVAIVLIVVVVVLVAALLVTAQIVPVARDDAIVVSVDVRDVGVVDVRVGGADYGTGAKGTVRE